MNALPDQVGQESARPGTAGAIRDRAGKQVRRLAGRNLPVIGRRIPSSADSLPGRPAGWALPIIAIP
jgi:hypothetical protein